MVISDKFKRWQVVGHTIENLLKIHFWRGVSHKPA